MEVNVCSTRQVYEKQNKLISKIYLLRVIEAKRKGKDTEKVIDALTDNCRQKTNNLKNYYDKIRAKQNENLIALF